MARGFTQIFVDYDDTYAPVAKLASSRVIPAIAAAEDLELEQMDVVTAFLAEKLDTEIYMEQAEGFKQGTEKEDVVYRLLRSLYGLRELFWQSGWMILLLQQNRWNEMVTKCQCVWCFNYLGFVAMVRAPWLSEKMVISLKV